MDGPTATFQVVRNNASTTRDFALNTEDVFRHVLASKTGMLVQRFMRLVDTEDR